jgi:PAS domain S-box-containing protein
MHPSKQTTTFSEDRYSAMNRSIHLLDVIEREKLDDIINIFTEVTGVASIITEVDGRPITKPFNFTGLCRKYSRSTPKGRRKCYDSDSYGGRETARLKKCLIYECFNAGLLDCGAPIIVEGYHLANIMCGQVLEKPIDKDVAIHRAQSIDIVDIDGYIEELANIPIMGRDRLRSIANLMEMITQTISELALQKFLLQRNSEQYLHKLINSVTDCIISTDADATISMINEAGAQMFGRDTQKFIGQSIHSLLADQKSKRTYQNETDKVRDGYYRGELTAVNNNYQTFPVQVSLSRLNTTEKRDPGYVAVIRDITEEKQMERMKEDLIGMLTHDMQNPVLSIQKAIELLVNESLGDLNAKQMDVLNLSLGTSRQLLGMVTDFLDIYRNENGQFVLRKLSFDFNQIFCEAINQLLFFALEKRVSIKTKLFSPPIAFEVDRNRLLRLFVNLLDNAIKFSPEGGKIEVFCNLLNSDNGGDAEVKEKIAGLKKSHHHFSGGNYAIISITDQGHGIPEESQKFIFDKFFTSKTRAGKGRKSLGLGLAFCKLVAEAHGGMIWTKSPLNKNKQRRNQGCRFNLILPVDYER